MYFLWLIHVRPKQHAVQCDGCDLWQHRTCDTGIKLLGLQYRTAVRYNVDINWQCKNCANPQASVDDLMYVADQDANFVRLS